MAYTGNSIVDYLKSTGVSSSYRSRKKLAAKHGISNYRGTASQNKALLRKLRSGSSSSSRSSNSSNAARLATAKKALKKLQKDLNKRKSSGSLGSSRGPSNPPPQPSSPSMPTPPMRTQAGVNKGSSNNTPTQYSTPGSSYNGGLYNMSEYGLVRFEGVGPQGNMDDDIVWLVDPNNQTLRPFTSSSALRNFFDGEVDIESIQTMDASALDEGGVFGGQGGNQGFQVLSNDYAIQRDGSARKLDFSNSQLQTRYGSGVNEELEQTMYSALKGMFNLMEGAGIDANTINKIKKSDSQMAFYVSALAYGGYSVGDIYSDIKKRELGIDDLSPISSTAIKQEYVSTNEYQNASGDTRIAPPAAIGSLNSAALDLPVYKLPVEAFQTLIPLLDYESDEFKAAMEDIETSYYDVMQQQLNASTEQDKAIADYNYQEWKDGVEKNLGIQLSNNALEAWTQVQGAMGQFSQRGIYGSGLQNEEVDSYLRRVRRDDQIMREGVMDSKEKEEMQYFLTAATTEQINELVNSDPEKARKWGLIPSDEVKEALSLDKLKEKYPNAKEEDLAEYISILLDENGNYRSTLYQTQMGSLKDLHPESASIDNATGINTAKDQFKRFEARRKSLLEEEEAYKQYTTPNTAFLRTVDDSNKDVKKLTGGGSHENVNLRSILKKAANNRFSGETTGAVPPAPGRRAPLTPGQGAPLTSGQRSSMAAQLKDAQAQLDKLMGRQKAQNQKKSYTPPKIKTPKTVNNPSQGPSTGLRMSMANSPQQRPIYNPGGNSFSTAKSTPAVGGGSSTVGGSTIQGIWGKAKSKVSGWFN